MADALLRGDVRGGLAIEGFEYSQQALAYVVQFLLALHTAGQDDPDVWGPQAVLTDNPFWNEMIPAYLHSLSPQKVTIPDYEWLGDVTQPAWYEDEENSWGPDFIGIFGPLGWYDDLNANTGRLEALRWIQRETAPGGADFLVSLRVAEAQEFSLSAILAFLLFDPEAAEADNPRPDLDLVHFAPGIGRLLSRTDWTADATVFTWSLGWNSVDHQHCDGNQFEFYRAGEWLTKERTGYDFVNGGSEFHNTLTLENDPLVDVDPSDFTALLSQSGSQWTLVPSSDPEILATSASDDFVYALGDATNLYNSDYVGAVDIEHASRSILWLKPDHIVVYDRAVSKTDGRFKRFWLNLPEEPEIDGRIATMTTASGQQLTVTSLLSADADISGEFVELSDETVSATGEPMRFRLRVEAPGGPRESRFLHVLQGLDLDGDADEATLLESDAGTRFAGALVKDTVVLFPVDLADTIDELTYTVPTGTFRHLITGLTPGGAFEVTTEDDGVDFVVTIRSGGDATADDGGVLSLDLR